MKVQELRIGNLVCDYGAIVPVTPLMLSRLVEIENSGKICINISPILLTEEWLLKFGFKKDYQEFTIGRIILDCEYTDAGEWVTCYDGKCIEVDVKHVHQLQNLYFALTGQELKTSL